jgi:hypothetical protein
VADDVRTREVAPYGDTLTHARVDSLAMSVALIEVWSMNTGAWRSPG